ncbi:MAG: NADH-quinone oxidoreductase subunit L, partial [Clostridia bacterium]|nr:NADH-quinone oxidoreductase subunit L [Clostridia bacterium]
RAPAYQGTVLSNVLALTGGFAFLVTAILALSQNHSKRVLAYSTVSNLGLIILCAGLNTPLAMAAAVLLLIFHAISKGLLFLCAGAAEQELGTREIEAMAGLAARMPFTATIAFIGMLSMLVPPFGMLAGKWAAMEAVAAAGSGWSLAAIGLLVAGSAVTVVFWAKWMGRLLSQGLPREKVAERVPFFFAL